MRTLHQSQLLPGDQDPAALQTLERLTELRTQLQEAHGTYPANPLAQVRAEWEEDIERVGRGKP